MAAAEANHIRRFSKGNFNKSSYRLFIVTTPIDLQAVTSYYIKIGRQENRDLLNFKIDILLVILKK